MCSVQFEDFRSIPARLAASGLGDPFKKTLTYDAADYYKPEDDASGYEDDNNEPM